MNLLLTSVGRRVKIVEYFKESLMSISGKVIAVDCDRNAPALYYADEFAIVPRIDDPDYLNKLIDICDKYKIEAIISLIDPELSLLADNKDKFDKRNIELVLSPKNMIDMSFNKQFTHDYLIQNNIPTVPTVSNLNDYQTIGEFQYPLILKPKTGSASLGIIEVMSEKELTYNFAKYKNLIVQPFFKDREFGVDVYIDLHKGNLVDLFIKEKLAMRAGETDKSISIHNDKIKELVKNLVSVTNFRGPIDIDCFEYQNQYYISEINPRFGGGYPHAKECGVNFMEYIINNLQGNTNDSFQTFNYKEGLTMMKYDRVVIK